MLDQSIKLVKDMPALAQEGARRVVVAAREAITRRGLFTIALSGGSTPKMLYQLLAGEPYRSQVDWSKVEFYFGDERCVPPNHADSNYRMAVEMMLNILPIPAGQVHRMRGEVDPELAAAEYDRLLQQKFPTGGMDMVLLGMGDDGHTASLFPYSGALAERKRKCVANYLEKTGSWRITLTATFINQAKDILILAAGASKARRIHEVIEGPQEPLRLPIQMIDPPEGKVAWLLDANAAGML